MSPFRGVSGGVSPVKSRVSGCFDRSWGCVDELCVEEGRRGAAARCASRGPKCGVSSSWKPFANSIVEVTGRRGTRTELRRRSSRFVITGPGSRARDSAFLSRLRLHREKGNSCSPQLFSSSRIASCDHSLDTLGRAIDRSFAVRPTPFQSSTSTAFGGFERGTVLANLVQFLTQAEMELQRAPRNSFRASSDPERRGRNGCTSPLRQADAIVQISGHQPTRMDRWNTFSTNPSPQRSPTIDLTLAT